MKKTPLATLVLGLALALGTAGFAPSLAAEGPATPFVSVLKGDANYWTGYDPVNLDGTINVVVEIPAGTTAKYEVSVKTGMIELEQKHGKPRFVQYLGYPCNYGNVPRSILARSKGGDGDPLDVLLLGPAVPTGSVVKGRPIGVLSLVDGGETDDKLVVAMTTGPFATVSSLDDLNRRFPGVTGILQTWFTSYKGYDKDGKLALSSPGFKGRVAAIKLVGDSVLDFENSIVTDADRRPLDEKGNPYLYRWPGAKNLGE